VVELCAEPAYNLVVVCEQLPLRAAVDGAALVAKATVTYAAVVTYEGGSLSFALAQCAYAAAQVSIHCPSPALRGVRLSAERRLQLLGLYSAVALQLCRPVGDPRRWLPSGIERGRQLLPHARLDPVAGGWWWCSAESAAEAGAMSRQAVLKHLLTEGDKLVLLLALGGQARHRRQSLSHLLGTSDQCQRGSNAEENVAGWGWRRRIGACCEVDLHARTGGAS
jgi:hypothetical protein